MSAPTANAPRPQTTGAKGQTDFDAVADAYDESLPEHVVEHYLAKRVAFVRQYVAPGRTLDVGCGTGVLAERLARVGYEVTGVDPFRGMLAYMKARAPQLNAVHALGQRLPFADATFDLTYCVAVLHHVAEPTDVRNTLMEMARVTRPGGYVLVWDHNPRNPYWPILMNRVPQDTGAERLIPENEIVTGLKAGGATPVIIRPLGFMPDFTPKPLTGLVANAERIVERTPGLNRLAAHNVILAAKGA